MTLLVDTHLLLWAAGEPQRLSKKARPGADDTHESTLQEPGAGITAVST